MSHLNINGVDKPLDHVYVKARTENLFDKDSDTTNINGDSRPGVEVSAGTYSIDNGTPHYVYYRIGYSGIAQQVNPRMKKEGIVASDSLYVWRDANIREDGVMLNIGSTALPYEPYLITKEAWEAKTRVILHGLTNPLCGIDTYKDTLDLSAGPLTRYVKKLVFDGTEDWQIYTYASNTYRLSISDAQSIGNPAICSHFVNSPISSIDSGKFTMGSTWIYIRYADVADLTDFKAYLASEYAAGHPVTVWYVLATPTTETIALPSNLTGTVEGYLTQSGTPTPTNPIYPTANGTLEQNGTYSLDTGAYAIAWGRADTFTGTNSISARCYGLPVKSWEIDGNSQQSGTPAPDNIVMPEFVGERTANLVEKRIDGCNISSSGVLNSNASWNTFVAKIEQGKTYSVDVPSYAAFYELAPIIGSSSYDGQRYAIESSFTSPIDGYVAFRKVESELTAMCNEGSTPIPYEPYGYKLTITSANQTAPVYLGQVPTTRKVKKLVLDGTENWALWSSGQADVERYYYKWDKTTPSDYGLICTHFRFTKGDGNFEHIRLGGSNRDDFVIFISKAIASTVEDFKTYLATQYANGTPVTAWYTLATPETGIVNEPLCKIDTYADTLTSEQAGITIQTTDGNNTISVSTSIAPSRFEVKVHAKSYTWEWIRETVRSGKAPQYYPIGSILYDNFDSSTGTAFQVVAHDHHFDPTLTAQGYTHSMTLCEVALTDVIQFDAQEAFIYTNTTMPAGTYKFKIPDYDATHGGNKTYYFTSTADLSAGSQIVMKWVNNQPPESVTAYSGAMPWNSTTAVTGFNALPLTEWDESVTATDIGTIAGPISELGHSDFGTMNHIHRVKYGSNNYLQSGLRQYINSGGVANAWWQAQTVFDRPYTNRSSAGKLTKLNAGMVAVMAKPEIQSITNRYFETTSLDGTTFTLSTNYTITTDKMFLLSPMEVNLNTVDTTVGSVLDYYVNADNAKRIKYRQSDSAAYEYWLRTSYPFVASAVRSVIPSGALNSTSAINSCGVASACVIQ